MLDQASTVGFSLNEEADEQSKPASGLVGTSYSLVLVGAGANGGTGLKFQATLKILTEGGSIKAPGDHFVISKANAVTLLLAAATGYRSNDPQATCERQIKQAAAQSYAKLREAHVANYQALFRRTELGFGKSGGADLANLPTDERLERVKQGAAEQQLVEQYFQFGRYPLIASRRPGDLAANLQGVWADGFRPPWNSDITSTSTCR